MLYDGKSTKATTLYRRRGVGAAKLNDIDIGLGPALVGPWLYLQYHVHELELGSLKWNSCKNMLSFCCYSNLRSALRLFARQIPQFAQFRPRSLVEC